MTDLSIMVGEKSFQQILEETLAVQGAIKDTFEPPPETPRPVQNFATMELLQRFSAPLQRPWNKKSAAKKYLHNKREPANSVREDVIQPKAHRLSPLQGVTFAQQIQVDDSKKLLRAKLTKAQLESCEYLIALGGSELKASTISEKLVKKTFRTLAKNLHPDTAKNQSDPEVDFHRLRQAYTNLLQAFSDRPAKAA